MSDLLPDNANAPHAVILHVTAEVAEKLPGDHYGRVSERRTTAVAIPAGNRPLAVQRMNELLAQLRGMK